MALNNMKNANRPKRRWPPGRSEDVRSLPESGLSGLPTSITTRGDELTVN